LALSADQKYTVSAYSAYSGRKTMSDGEDERWMRLAIELAWQCPPSATAYSVGAVIVDARGDEISRGFSREGSDPVVHAEESALGKLAADDPRLAGATIYSTLEPCSQRKSRPRTCTQLIIGAGLRRVVIGWREPALFVADCQGYELLAEAGLEVAELPALAALAAAPNRHLPGLGPADASLVTALPCATGYSY
jgi:diaminohydroxyphosphoribosylaminopyrimidine deaminase / 5-amino-6-(5-phosphoribosylamino)uracil reductase